MKKNPPASYDWSGIPNLIIRGKGNWCHARVEVNGTEHVRSLHIQADDAGANAPFVLDALRAYKVRIAQDSFAILQLTRSRNELSKIGDVFTAYEKACSGRDVLDSTVTTTKSRFAHICRTVHGESFDAESAHASIVTRELAERFEHAKLAAVKEAAKVAAAAGTPWSPEELEQRMQSTKNSAKSVLQQARALFAKDLLECVHYRGLVLPDVGPFMRYRVDGGTTISAFVAPPVDIWKKIRDDLPALKTTSPAKWIAFQLAVNCGLRRSSARNARWSWCVENADGSASMRITRAKGNHSTVTIAPNVWTELKAVRVSLDYMIPGASETPATRTAAVRAADKRGEPLTFDPLEPTRDEIIGELVQWLRARGLTVDVARTPFHLLRKIYGDAMRSEHGLDEAQKALGHSSNKLTHAVYSDHRSTKHVQTA